MAIRFQQKIEVVIVLCSGKELGGTTTVTEATWMVSIITDITRIMTVLCGIIGNELQLKEQKWRSEQWIIRHLRFFLADDKLSNTELEKIKWFTVLQYIIIPP